MNHDISVGEMIDEKDEAEIGLLGRDAELQFVRLAAAFNERGEEIARLRGRISAIWEQLTATEQERIDAALADSANTRLEGQAPR